LAVSVGYARADEVHVRWQKTVEDAPRASEERFRNMADNISQLAWVCDRLVSQRTDFSAIRGKLSIDHREFSADG